MAEMEHVLAIHPFLDGIPKSKLDLLASFAEEVSFEPGELMIREDEPAKTFFLIVSGKLALEVEVAGVPHTIQTLREGDVLGVSWLFPPYRWRFTGHVLQPTEAVRFDADAVRRQLDLDNELGHMLLHRFAAVLANRLQAARLQLLDLYGGVVT